jgi:tellurite resistance-related uncharacterized protein
MPLMHGKSKKAFESNVKTEIHHGKPMPQALAIAYATKRAAMKKKMALGGEVEHIERDGETPEEMEHQIASEQLAHGGQVMEKEAMHKLMHPGYAEGGEVDYDAEHKRILGQSQDVLAHKKGGVSASGHLKSAIRNEEYAKSGKASMPSIHKEMARESRKEAAEKHGEKLQTIYDMPNPKLKGLAHGGMIDEIMAKRHPQHKWEGGEIMEHADYESIDPHEKNSLHMDPDFLSEDQSMNEDMGHPDEEPKMRRKKMLKGIFSE